MRPEVAAAMAEATSLCVDVLELQARASAIIAHHTGAAAGIVTNGASAALLLGTAACITGLDPAAMARLPDLRGLKDEVVMVRSQRNQYDHAIRATGARIVEVGLADRYAGAGVRDAEPWEIEGAIGERTAAVHYVADAASLPALEAVVEVAHARDAPVVVDAAAQLPPADNLRRFIAAGADLVAFSGGKTIGGPQASGILCGRRDLIAAAALQMLDMDYPEAAFQPSPAFIDRRRLKGLPPHGIGRSAKVGKEQVVGLLTALELFAAEGDEVRRSRWLKLLEGVRTAMGTLPGLTLTLSTAGPVPTLALETKAVPMSVADLYRRLVTGDPAIHLDPAEIAAGRLHINPTCLRGQDVPILASRLKQLLG
jgi:L-seryl-tRNA(Ser) seleniumtransferase